MIKTGLAPLLIDLMKRGFLTAVAANGSVLVHDAEIAMVGSTSEDVDATLSAGAFGGAEETGRVLNRAAAEGSKSGIGLGEAMGHFARSRAKASRLFPSVHTYEAKIPFTAHITIGGDIGHFHPNVDGAALGATTHTDFRLLATIVRDEWRRCLLNIGLRSCLT